MGEVGRLKLITVGLGADQFEQLQEFRVVSVVSRCFFLSTLIIIFLGYVIMATNFLPGGVPSVEISRRFVIRVFPLYLPWLAPQPFLGHPCYVSSLSLDIQLAKSECLLVKTHSLCLLGQPKGVPLPPKPNKGGNRRREGS